MAIEQERRFLVRGPFPKTDGVAISQGYLSAEGTYDGIARAIAARPAWLGEDITTSFEYANVRLAERPFTKW